MERNISVIIPNHNRSRLIGRAIESVLSQTLPAREIIVVDDGSNDSSRTYIKSQYPEITLLTQQHQGVSAARNNGILNAGCDWLALLDSDDEWLPEKLEKQHLAWKTNPSYRIIHTNESWIRNNRPLKQLKKHQKFGGFILRHCLPLCVISPSSILVHREVFSSVGLFNENYPVCEDYDMWLRVCARYPVLFLDDQLIIKYGGHDDQLSRKYVGMDRYRIMAIANLLKLEKLSSTDRQAAVEEMLKKIDIYLKGAEKHANNVCVEEFKQLREQYRVANAI